MKRLYFTIILITTVFYSISAQSLNFEEINTQTGMPVGWMRSNRQAGVDSCVKRDGNFSLCIDGANSYVVTQMPFLYNGSKLEVSGYIRIDEIAGMVEIQANMNAGPNVQQRPEDHIITCSFVLDESTGGEWQRFSFEVPFCEQITSCNLLITLLGSGKFWVDDIRMLIDGHTLDDVGTRPSVSINYKAQEDTRFKNGSGFAVNKAFTPRQIENLIVLCRVWGFMKYYHPAIARGEYNWDYELFAMLPKIVDLDPAQRNLTLYEWVLDLGEITPEDVTEPFYVNWLNDKNMLGSALSDKLKSIARSERETFNYYLTTVYGIGLALYKNENPYPEMDYSDTGVKLAAVFRLWNAIAYFYPYKHLTDDWDKALEIAIGDMATSTSRVDYLLSIYRLLSRLNDSHAMVQDPAQTLVSLYKYAIPFVTRSYVDGKFAVTQIFDKDSINALRPGDAIISIGDQSVAEYLEEMKDRVPASNFSTFTRDVSALIPYASKEEYITFTVDRDDRIIEQKVKAYPLKEYYEMAMEFMGASRELPVAYRIINDSIVYLQLTGISRNDLDSVVNIYAAYPKMILDMRGYPQGYVSSYLSKLIPGYPMAAKSIKPNTDIPGSFDVVLGDYIGGGDIGIMPRKIVVLVNEYTQSMSEYMVMMLQNAPNVITAGSQTAGANGNTARLILPGNILAVFTGIGVLYPDGRETQGVGICIDELISPTLQGIREGRDEQLEHAVDILTQY